ncbi:hypothetical protein SAMN05443572_115169 [Myxococcus fulvus]|uniref:Uncharacterized protein n=1 Tax=Myxococcus fulvus TaxID=33 RepID=A0A511TC95_MYXFU|nr:hypothetical protein [Myxococcus fulvus]GEN11806.1 hypothetical protein MFU01_68430 [Myxococcus fulvus]SEU40568.1 hypothetical protein SAMN05443572_115169 [Myxococcus fulvus]
MESRHLSAPAWSAFKSWLLKLTGVPVSRLRLLTGGCPADELPALAKELKRVRADFKKRPNEVSAPADEGLRKDYAALGVPWSAWSEVASEVHRDLKRNRYARWTGVDALEFPEGPAFGELVTVVLFGGVEQARAHLLRRASLSEGSLEALWCRWLGGEPLEPETLRAFAGAPEQLAEPLYTPGIEEVLPLYFVEPDAVRAERALEVVAGKLGQPLLDFLRSLLGLWRQETTTEDVRARFDAFVASVSPSKVSQLCAPAYLYGRYVEVLPAHALLEQVGSRLECIAVPAKVADVQPVMEALTAVEELTAMGLGLRVEQVPGKVLLSAQEPETTGGDEFL